MTLVVVNESFGMVIDSFGVIREKRIEDRSGEGLGCGAQDRQMSSILIVDDDEAVLDVLSEMLTLAGHEVTIAHNGKDAVRWVIDGEFDLVITDLIMPEKEGIETITEIRRQSSDTPIIAISGGGRVGPNDYLETAKFIGADATLAKPFARQELLSTVDSLLA